MLRQRHAMQTNTDDTPGADPVEALILALTDRCGPDKSISPTDVARALRPDWQVLLPDVRRAAARLAQAGRIEVLRHGRPVDPRAFKGVIRLRTAKEVR